MLVRVCSALTVAFLFACQPSVTEPDWETLSWAEIDSLARGTTVNFMMWQGDPYINDYMQNYVVPTLKAAHGVDLQLTNGQGNMIVSVVSGELEAGKKQSELDMGWINGETFYQLRQIKGLYGPFTQYLENQSLINFEDPFIRYDFQQEVAGMECPWGSVQQVMIYNEATVPAPPRTMVELEAWVRAHPGKFTLPNEFTGMSFLKALLTDLAGGPQSLNGPFDEALYTEHATELWAYLNRIKPYCWKEGKTFPSQLSAMHQMFASGELDFTMSMNDSEVDNKVLQGLFPPTSRSYVPDFGSIRNSHYLGILRHAPNKAGAMVVINFLISPEAQLKKQDPAVWGDGTVLAVESLAPDWQERFAILPNRQYAPSRSEMLPRALPEPAPEYMLRLAKDFREQVIQ